MHLRSAQGVCDSVVVASAQAVVVFWLAPGFLRMSLCCFTKLIIAAQYLLNIKRSVINHSHSVAKGLGVRGFGVMGLAAAPRRLSFLTFGAVMRAL